MTIIPLNEEKAKKFLYKNSLTNCEIKKIAGDASFRSYYRIFCAEKISILMFAPPSHEEIQPFIDIDKFLFEHGFCAPEIFAIDEENGFLLL
ncbi:MAG TPA: phosphotransferase, partial [Rickettsiales bacterium]|nr:phosphotransferase [Rickettsiales bacterium]